VIKLINKICKTNKIKELQEWNIKSIHPITK